MVNKPLIRPYFSGRGGPARIPLILLARVDSFQRHQWIPDPDLHLLCSLGKLCVNLARNHPGVTKRHHSWMEIPSKLQLVGGWTNPSEKYARQIGSFPQIGVKIKNIWNHHLDNTFALFDPPPNYGYLKDLWSSSELIRTEKHSLHGPSAPPGFPFPKISPWNSGDLYWMKDHNLRQSPNFP